MLALSKLRPYLLVGALISILLSAILLLPADAGFARTLPTDTPAPELTLTQGVRQTVLDNGLTVLTKEIHTAPVVSVQVWYRVGSRNEPSGLNGISHQLEHLMFKGTRDRPIQFGRLFNALGSQSNAFTSYDQTAYFGTVERDKLDALLALEADRMENAIIDSDQLASEKRVVISELQGYENRPSYRLGRAVMRAAFPEHPYGLPVGGTKADVQRFTVDEVRNYYQTYYSPDQAVLVVVGDFATDATLHRIQDLYGSIPQRSPAALRNASTEVNSPVLAAAPTTSPQSSSSNAPIVLREPGSAALVSVVYPLPNITHPDVPAIDVMDMILTGGRSSRLYQALVESGLASSVGAYPAELIEPGWYNISATVAPGKPPSEVERVLERSLANLRQQEVEAAELERAKTQLRTYFLLSNQDVTSQALQLGYNQTVAGDYRYSDRYLAAIAEVTAADVRRVAQTYLDPNQKTVGFFEPTQPNGQPGMSAGESSRMVENFSPGEPVDPAEVAQYLPPVQAIATDTVQPLPESFQLPNGLRVLLLPDDSTPTVNLSGWIDAGSAFDTAAKAGTANLTADNLLNGTQSQTALSLAEQLENQGVNLAFSANREGVLIDGNTLKENLPTLVQTLADVLQHATFPNDQLELSRQRALIALRAELDDPQRYARRVFQQTLYPENHPFHSFPTENSLTQITQSDLVDFYQTHYRPDTTVLSLVGDFDPTQVRSLLDNALSQWQAEGSRPSLRVPSVRLPHAIARLHPTIPGKSEAVTYLGYGGISRHDPRFYAALVLNQILGGDTLSSRLGTEVRDRQGLTYGIYSYFQAGRYPGPFLISMQTSPDDANRAIDSTLALLQQLRQQGVTESELETAKRSITSSYPVELASPANLASVILNNTVDGLAIEELRQFPDKVEAVTSTQVDRAIQELIHPDHLIIVTAGPDAS